jgi:arylsulfatase A-like enzyme
MSATESKPLETTKRFNLLFLMTDEHQAAVMGVDGNPIVKTPNLDKLAADGIYFSAAYTPCPICVPARASILTGRSIGGTGIRRNTDQFLSVTGTPLLNQKTYDEVLNVNGYWSAYHGKWHIPVYRAGLTKTTDTSFYHNFGYAIHKDDGSFRIRHLEYEKLLEIIHQNEPIDVSQLQNGLQYLNFFRRPYEPVTTDFNYGQPSPKEIENNPVDKNGKPISQAATIGKLILDSKYSLTSFQRDLVLNALQETEKVRKHEDKNFNVTASFIFPHPPMVVTEPYFSLYRDKNNKPIKELDTLIPESIDDRSKESPYNLSTDNAVAYFHDKTKITDVMSVYYALVTEIDDSIGKIIQKLKDIGEYDNTLIVYCSDHGEMLGAHGLCGKFVFYEESIRVPLILKLPGGSHKGLKIDRPVNLTDLFATILDYTISDTVTPSEGKTLRAIIENPKTTQRKDYTVIEWGHENIPSYCVVTKDWKFMVAKSDKAKNALYDRKKDPNELVNLLASPPLEREKYNNIVSKMKSKLLEYMEEINHADKEVVQQKKFF